MPITNPQAGGIYLPLLAAMAALALTGAALNARITTQAKAIAVVEKRAERNDLSRVLRQMIDCPQTYQRLCVEAHPARKAYNRKGTPVNEKFFEVVDIELLKNGEDIAVTRPDDRKTLQLDKELRKGRLKRNETWGILLHCNLDTTEIGLSIGRLHARGYNQLAKNPLGQPGKFHRVAPLCDTFDISDKISCPKGISYIDFDRRRLECVP